MLTVKTEYKDYLWGGQRLRPGQLTAEAGGLWDRQGHRRAPGRQDSGGSHGSIWS